MWTCLECGRKFRTVKAAERAANNGCPECGGVDIDDVAEETARERAERTCDCGSGLPSWWEYDGQGIPLCRVCPRCKDRKLSAYRREILRPYTQADVDESIEPEEY